MFDIGFLELIIVSVVGLLVLGPERLPGAIRTVMAYVNKIRRSFAGIRAEIERELQADEFRQDLHNQGIMKELKEAEKALRSELNSDGIKLGKDGYPIDEPYQPPASVDRDPEPAASTPESAAPPADAEASVANNAADEAEPTTEPAHPTGQQDKASESASEQEPRAAKP